MKNKKNSYSIRKLSVGASSIIVASMLFIGGGSVHAAESNHLENQEQSEVSASHSIELQHKNQEIQQPENKDNKNNHSETIDKTPTIHNNGYSYHETPSTDVKSNEGKQIDSQSNQPQTSMLKDDQQNPKKVAEHATKSINAKKEETRKNENAKSLVQPQQDDETTSEQTKMKESREQEITSEQKQLQSKDIKNTQQENQNIDQEKSQEKIKVQQSNIEKAQKSSRIDGKLDNQYNKDATQSNEGTASENVSEQHITAKDAGVTRNNRGDERLNQEKPTTSSDKELKVDDIDKDLSTKESPDSRKGIKALTKNSQATTRNTATSEASKELKDQTNKVASQKEYKNHDPIILVHGFNGYASGTGPITGKGNYWGGDRLKIIQDYRAKNYNVMEASVSAFGSNYDRAVELYYYIKGGRVDYGAAHAAKYGHERYGKTYAGAYKDWKPGQKIHLIGHSMGGQTIRYLEELLRHGSPEEVEYQKQHGGDISPLYKGGQDNMISSITTIATPHNGTHAADLLGNEEIIRQVAYDYARSKGNKLSHVDVGLSQWGLKQREDETLAQYIQRVKQSKLWTTKDNGFYDLTTEGTDILNQKTSLNPNIVYKTYQGESTRPGPNGTQKADVNMNIGYTLTANTIGKVKDKAWRENDGLVSVISGQYPLNQAHTSATNQVQKGVWQVTPVKHNWDHGDFVGTDTSEVRISKEELEDFWDNMFEDMVRNEKVTDKQ